MQRINMAKIEDQCHVDSIILMSFLEHQKYRHSWIMSLMAIPVAEMRHSCYKLIKSFPEYRLLTQNVYPTFAEHQQINPGIFQ